jgi:hypothetical protein
MGLIVEFIMMLNAGVNRVPGPPVGSTFQYDDDTFMTYDDETYIEYAGEGE